MIAKAVVPAAGEGTRVASVRGDLPKECLEVGGIPMIALALMEMALSGVSELAVIISPDKPVLNALLEALPPFPGGDVIDRLYPGGLRPFARTQWPVIRTFEQPRPRGVIDAVRRAADYIGDDPFGLVMPDNLLVGDRPVMGEVFRAAEQTGTAVMALNEISRADALRTGNCGGVTLSEFEDDVCQITEMADKGTGSFEIPDGVNRIPRALGRSVVPAAFAALGAPNLPDGEIDDGPRFQALARSGRLHGVLTRARLLDLGQVAGIEAARKLLGD